MVGQTDNTLICDISGADNLNPTITYQWTRNGGGEVGISNTFTISSAGLSDAGNYTCRATVNSNLLRNEITVSAGQIVMVQSELIAYRLLL
jgi:subtilase family serine protease